MERLEQARRWLAEARRVVVLTGAGISTDSGLPDFRGPQGVWTKDPAAEKASHISSTTWATRRARARLAAAGSSTRRPPSSRTRASRARRPRAQRPTPHAAHPERGRPPPRGGVRSVARGRGARHRARVRLPRLRRPRPDRRRAGAGPGRRGRPALSSVRRDPQVGDDQLRAEPRARRPRSCGPGRPLVRPPPRRRHDPCRPPDRRGRPSRGGQRRPRGDRERVADRDGRRGRRRAHGTRSASCSRSSSPGCLRSTEPAGRLSAGWQR